MGGHGSEGRGAARIGLFVPGTRVRLGPVSAREGLRAILYFLSYLYVPFCSSFGGAGSSRVSLLLLLLLLLTYLMSMRRDSAMRG